jgi:hypothetical protein
MGLFNKNRTPRCVSTASKPSQVFWQSAAHSLGV